MNNEILLKIIETRLETICNDLDTEYRLLPSKVEINNTLKLLIINEIFNYPVLNLLHVHITVINNENVVVDPFSIIELCYDTEVHIREYLHDLYRSDKSIELNSKIIVKIEKVLREITLQISKFIRFITKDCDNPLSEMTNYTHECIKRRNKLYKTKLIGIINDFKIICDCFKKHVEIVEAFLKSRLNHLIINSKNPNKNLLKVYLLRFECYINKYWFSFSILKTLLLIKIYPFYDDMKNNNSVTCPVCNKICSKPIETNEYLPLIDRNLSLNQVINKLIYQFFKYTCISTIDPNEIFLAVDLEEKRRLEE